MARRTCRSGASTLTTSPEANRSPRRCSSPSSSSGERSQVITSWRPAVAQRVEGVEELLLGPRLVGEELDVVEQQDVDSAEALLEARRVLCADGADELRGELLHGRVAHGEARAEAADVVADRVEEVRLAEARPAVDEERVVGLARAARRRPGRRRGRSGCRGRSRTARRCTWGSAARRPAARPLRPGWSRRTPRASRRRRSRRRRRRGSPSRRPHGRRGGSGRAPRSGCGPARARTGSAARLRPAPGGRARCGR